MEMANLLTEFMNDVRGIIRLMFGNGHSSTIKHQTVHNVNLDLFADGLHDKLARIFCLIARNGTLLNLPPQVCPITIEEDHLFSLPSKVQPPGAGQETIMQHFKKYVTTVSVIPLFENINQNELRIKDIFKFFFLICNSSLFDPADTSGENFIKQLRIKTNNPNITLPFEATANHGIFDILSQHTYSMCGDKLLYEYIRRLYPMMNIPGNPDHPWSAGGVGNPPRNVTVRHLVILNFAWQCTLAYIQSISRTAARFPPGGAQPNPNFPTDVEINTALDILKQIQFVGFILQTPTQAVENDITDYRHYTYANATFVFRGQNPASAVPFAVSQGIAAECINELYPNIGDDAALPREGAPHRYKVQCKAKLQEYINGRPLSNYIKSIIYVLLKFAGDTSHIVNYMLFKNAIGGIGLDQGAPPVLPLPVVGQLKTTIFCCERALIARCIQENHSFYCRDVKILSQEVPLALGDCYYFNVNPMEEYSMKSSLLESFRASAGELQGDIDTAIGILNTFIGPPGGPQGPPPNATEEERIEQLITFINFYKAYKKFVLFIESSKGKYDEFIRDVFPSHFQNRTARSSRARNILNMLTPLTLLHGNIKNKKRFELTSLIYSAYYGPLVSILSQLEKDHITRDIGTMGMGLGPDIFKTLQTVQGNFTTKINIAGLRDTEEEIRGMLNPENNLNDAKTVESLLNIIKSQRYIDNNLEGRIDALRDWDQPDDDDDNALSGGATGATNQLSIAPTSLDPKEFIEFVRTRRPTETDVYTKENLSAFILEKNEEDNIPGDILASPVWVGDFNNNNNLNNTGNEQFIITKKYDYDLLIEYFASMVEYEVTQNILDDELKENIGYLLHTVKTYEQSAAVAAAARVEAAENKVNDTWMRLRRVQDKWALKRVRKVLKEMAMKSAERAWNSARKAAKIARMAWKAEAETIEYIYSLLRNGDIDELEPLPDALRNITVHPLIAREMPVNVNVNANAANNTAGPSSSSSSSSSFGSFGSYGPWMSGLGGGKNIRSVSKMYRKNNKKVKKTRKIKKNNYKKSKTSKKMTKTSVQNKKSIKNKDIKNKGIKNMKNTKNKKVNKSKTKKSKKN